jgi:hypothetical protein
VTSITRAAARDIVEVRRLLYDRQTWTASCLASKKRDDAIRFTQQALVKTNALKKLLESKTPDQGAMRVTQLKDREALDGLVHDVAIRKSQTAITP